MVEFNYLYRGVCGLANAHKASSLAGHLGAAVLAGYFWGEDHAALDEEVHRGVEAELNRVIQGEEAIWYNAKKAGITPNELFEPLPQEESDPKRVTAIAEALAGNIEKTRQSGHNVIFASIALRALHDHPKYATPSTVQGMVKLIRQFDGVTAGRGYYGKDKGWLQGEQVTVDAKGGVATYRSEKDLATVVLSELVRSASIRRQGFGGMWHIINHAAGLIELSRFGYRELARKGFPAHQHHVRLWRTLPNVEEELGPVKASTLDPRTPEYWRGMLKRDEARLTHRIKTLYGFTTLLQLVDDRTLRQQAEKSFLYLMA